jgi:hypothetical protein
MTVTIITLQIVNMIGSNMSDANSSTVTGENKPQPAQKNENLNH